MNSATCAALTAVFPLILVTLTLSRRELHIKIRRLKATRWVMQATVGVCLLGLAWSLVGVNHGGWSGPNAVFLWVLTAAAGVSLGFFVVAHQATAESEEDKQGA